jgi:hypothetical protein
MLNPSKADARIEDNTLKAIIEFSVRWKYVGLEVVNLYGWRATQPEELNEVEDPVGPDNDRHIYAAFLRADTIVVAWGSFDGPNIAKRVKQVLNIQRPDRNPKPFYCLGLTKDGHPRHPLYVRRTQPLLGFSS